MAESLAGRLLIANPALTDENFFRTVVFICMHDTAGAFGLVLNRPDAEEPVDDTMPEWTDHCSAPPVLFRGGPVHPGAGVALARLSGRVPDEGWTPVFDNVGVFALERPPGEAFLDLTAHRIFSGYAGWTGGQLDAEVKDGGWFVVPPAPEDIFTPEPASLWQRVLKRQPGAMAMFAFFPTDPRAN